MPAATRNFSDKLACVIDAFVRPILLKAASFFTVRHQGRGCLRHLPMNARYRIAACPADADNLRRHGRP